MCILVNISILLSVIHGKSCLLMYDEVDELNILDMLPFSNKVTLFK